MKQFLSVFIFLFSITLFAQKEGQDFCTGDSTGDYFPLTIDKKKIFWYSGSYTETFIGEKIINNKIYRQFKQEWNDGSVDLLLLRKQNGQVLQYDIKEKKDKIRYDTSYGENYSWNDFSDGKYTILSFDGKLQTPICMLYKNLLVIRAEYEKVTYNFYYQKGYGYVGATKNDKLISYVTPRLD